MTEELKLRIAELGNKEIAVIGDFPSREIAKEMEKEIKSWIRKAKKEGVLQSQYLTQVKRTGRTWAVVVFCYDQLTINILSVGNSDTQSETQKRRSEP